MSYFHEYFLNNGQKTLRQHSELLNLNNFKKDWAIMEEDFWEVDQALDKIRHYDIVPKRAIGKLRKADKIEIKAGQITEYQKNKAGLLRNKQK